jgi:hypothetical protein
MTVAWLCLDMLRGLCEHQECTDCVRTVGGTYTVFCRNDTVHYRRLPKLGRTLFVFISTIDRPVIEHMASESGIAGPDIIAPSKYSEEHS